MDYLRELSYVQAVGLGAVGWLLLRAYHSWERTPHMPRDYALSEGIPPALAAWHQSGKLANSSSIPTDLFHQHV